MHVFTQFVPKPHDIAAHNGHAAVARSLLAADGIQVNQATNNGCTPLDVAYRNRNNNIAAFKISITSNRLLSN